MNVIQIAECKGEKAGLSLCPKMKYEMKDYDASSKEWCWKKDWKGPKVKRDFDQNAFPMHLVDIHESFWQ